MAPSSHELHALHHKKSAWVPKAHIASEHVAPTSPKKDPRVQCPTARVSADHHVWPKKTSRGAKPQSTSDWPGGHFLRTNAKVRPNAQPPCDLLT